jgi:5-methylcytosine-specific restriction endonuclease McrA
MKTLLLDKLYRPISFISFRRMIKLIVCNKAEVISTWPSINYYNKTEYPAIIRLKNYIRKHPIIPRFNYRGVFRRDAFTCCYTGKILPPSQLTVDHVIPKSRGGQSSWENCVTASLEVNSKKGSKTPEEAGLTLLKKPTAPADSLTLEYLIMQVRHPEWEVYFPGAHNERA